MTETYIQYGLDKDLAEKLSSINIPKSTFEKTSSKNLKERYRLTDK